jgi:hypothetical protein
MLTPSHFYFVNNQITEIGEKAVSNGKTNDEN